MSLNLLIAGATGALGSLVASHAAASGHRVRSLARSKADWNADALDPGSLNGCCEGMDVVFSAMGASVGLSAPDKRSFTDVDTTANLNLLAEAKKAKVKRFVYVAAYTEPGYAWTRYIKAHEKVVAAIRKSEIPYTILRPTAFFTSLDVYLRMARRGLIPMIGDGDAKTNPIHPADLATVAVGALADGPAELPVGGPETLSRRGIGMAAFEALGKDPHFLAAPASIVRLNGKIAEYFNPRLGELIEFAAAVSITNSLAPKHGTQKLLGYFRALNRSK